MKLKKCKRLQATTKKTTRYSAVYRNEEGKELIIHFINSSKTGSNIPTEVMFDGIKCGCKLRSALDAAGIEKRIVDFMESTKSRIDRHYLKKAKNLKKAII